MSETINHDRRRLLAVSLLAITAARTGVAPAHAS